MLKKLSLVSPEIKIILGLTLARLILHVICINNYGIFRDELYYIACGEHLDFGYVDHPPFAALIAKISTALFGNSLFAIRIFSVLASSLVVFFAGLFTLEFGGNRKSIIISCLVVLFVPVLLGSGSFFSMNSFDQLFWAITIYIVIRILRTGNQKLWIWFGIIVGIGFQNKISILFLCFGLFTGLILTSHRKMLLDKHLWIGALVAFLIALPNILWQIYNDWPTMEFIHNASTYKNMPLSVMDFILGQIMNMNPTFFPLVLLGLWFFFFDKFGKIFSLFGWMFISLLILFVSTKSKTYYMAPVFPVIIAAGAVVLSRIKPTLMSTVYITIIVAGISSLPFGLPVLPVEQYIAYSRFTGITPKPEERSELNVLPQLYADMFGWKEMVDSVGRVYNSLDPEEKKDCGIYAQNYGEAGAIDFFGRQYGLPYAFSGHNSYWLWGTDRVTDKNIMIIIGGDPEDHKKVYEEVKTQAFFSHKYVMPFENNLNIYLCRGLKIPLKKVWPDTKFYI